ncbi:uncharacterized protein B0T23DRAFT_37008 [Neurospora hispaniola]|uniref:RRM domain-containing protein n=1 Tax=Neurospora hispaniola TaxID=588809 RepID=A0AAJ0MVX1_9PEZI|nr:hypothetical protein B0T23DRAFT_37008 [Neurospora hispaniola]
MAATKDLETASAQESAPIDAMDTTADLASEKKSKKEKKEKKDKSSKKRKATEEPAESVESAETVDAMDTTADAAAAASSDEKPKKSSKKRKAELTEIEIDVTAPEPPSKKAKRLLKKGKTLPTKPSSDKGDDSDDSDNETAAKDGDKKKKKEKKERSPHGVWIGNLRFTVTKSELKQWLVDNSGGSITPESITRVHMPTAKAQPGQPKKEKPENRGFAYVDFDSLATKVAAIALSETEWYKRKLLIKDATSFEGRPEKKKEEEEGDAKGAAAGGKKDEALVGGKFAGSTKIFVGNLSFDTTEDDLRNHFDKCGAIRWVKVATFEDSGKCKGYGWVNFEEGEAAQWAVKGFVKIREEIPELEDFMDEDQKAEAEANDGDNADAEKTKEKKETEKRIKTRKWWVNQLHGRTLKIELAEDDKTRYDKRFRGKGAAGGKKQGQDGGERPQRVPYKKREEGGNGQIKTAQDISVARLTGAPVAHQGKKTTFE